MQRFFDYWGMPAPAVSAAATPVIHSGYVQAAAATLLLAAPAITAVTGFLARKRLVGETWLDMPVGLTAVLKAGTETPSQLLLGEPEFGYHKPGADSTGQGWLVLLGITNPGWTRVCGREFRAPLTFTFPGRQIHAARILPDPVAVKARRAARAPAIGGRQYRAGPAGDKAQ